MSPGPGALVRGAFEILPAIDLLDGQAVRLRQGEYDSAYHVAADPVAVARGFAEAGASRVHVVDLEGARSGRPVHAALIGRIAEAAGVHVQVGGGLRTLEHIDALFAAGAGSAIVGTVAGRDPELLRRMVDRWPGRILVGLDARGGRVALEGWLTDGGETLFDAAARVADLPLEGIVYTDIASDGMGSGPDVERTATLGRAVGVPVVASGGVGSQAHLDALREHVSDGIAGAIVGRAIYQGEVDLAEALRRARS